MSNPIPPIYKTANWAEYSAALKRRGSLTIWFDPDMAWEAAPSGKRGRQQVYSDVAIQTCLTLKVVLGMALRRTTGFVASLLELECLDWSAPDSSTLSRRQKTSDVAIPRRLPAEPMHLLIDSTGVIMKGDGEWHARKHDPSKRRRWLKLHLGIDAQTLEVQAVEVTGAGVGDAPMLPGLLAQIPPDQDIATGELANADGAYGTRKCNDAIADRGATAVISPRKNAKPWKLTTKRAVVRNEALRV